MPRGLLIYTHHKHHYFVRENFTLMLMCITLHERKSYNGGKELYKYLMLDRLLDEMSQRYNNTTRELCGSLQVITFNQSNLKSCLLGIEGSDSELQNYLLVSLY